MSLKGDLSTCEFPDSAIVSHDEVGVLKRNTIWPKQEFIILQLSPDTVGPIIEQIMAAGLSRRIIHLQIERDGEILLGAYDNFHRECVVTGPQVSPELLNELQSDRVIKSFEVARTAGK